MIIIETLRLKNDIGKDNKITLLISLKINVSETKFQKDDTRKRIIPKLTKPYKTFKNKFHQTSGRIISSFLLHYWKKLKNIEYKKILKAPKNKILSKNSHEKFMRFWLIKNLKRSIRNLSKTIQIKWQLLLEITSCWRSKCVIITTNQES